MTTPFTDPPAAPAAPGDAPARTQPRATFTANADAGWAWLFNIFWPWFTTFRDWYTTFKAELSSYTVGQIYGLRYTFDGATAATDPGAGKIRLNNADLTLATALYLSETDADAANQGPNIATWDDGAQALKGLLRIVKGNDTATFFEYQVSGSLVDAGGWDTLTLSYLNHNGAIVDGDPVVLVFDRYGTDGADAEFVAPTRTIAVDGSVTSADNGYLLDVTASGVDLTLDSPAALGAGWSCMLLPSAYSVTLAGDFNDGTVSAVIPNGNPCMLTSDGVKHRVVQMQGVPAGTVLQEITGTDNGSTGSSTSYTGLTQSSKSITPRSTNSRIVVECSFAGQVQAAGAGTNSTTSFAVFESTAGQVSGNSVLGVANAAGINAQINAPTTLRCFFSNTTLDAKSFTLRGRNTGAAAAVYSATAQIWTLREIQL